MSSAWNNWYHVITNTYGTWLRGDPRGWRERHHRKHVDGDYKNPPKPGTWERIYALSQRLMKRNAVHLDLELARIAVQSVVQCLHDDGVHVLVATLDDHHLHLVGKFVDDEPRARMGWAKLAATKAVKAFVSEHPEQFDLDLKLGEGIWQKRCKVVPIADRSHQLQATNYVAEHSLRGAEMWMDEAIVPRWEEYLLRKTNPPQRGGR